VSALGRRGRARLEAVLQLVPAVRGFTVDVGCDHGMVARALGAVGTERMPERLPRRAGSFVVADGLAPFSDVDVAVVCGMGPDKVLHVLASGPTPRVAVVHSPQGARDLRHGLVAAGWRIDAERLAPEGRGFAEVMRIERGSEAASGLELGFGPRLLERGDPHLAAHASQLLAWWRDLAERVPADAPIAAHARAWISFLEPLSRP